MILLQTTKGFKIFLTYFMELGMHLLRVRYSNEKSVENSELSGQNLGGEVKARCYY